MSERCKTPDDCRIHRSAAISTGMYFSPIYDGHGTNLNPDQNVTSWQENCSTCGKQWTVSDNGNGKRRTEND